MFQYSPAQKEFVKQGLRLGLRSDGRTNNQRRNTRVTSDVLDNLAGSSHYITDHSQCQVYTGVKLKVSNSHEQNPQPQVYLQISSMIKMSKQQLQTMVYLQQLLLQHFINKQLQNFHENLVIPNSKRHFLELHIESFLLAQPHLILLEPLFFSVKKALLAVSTPKIECIFNQVTNQETFQLTNQSLPLQLGKIDSIMVVGWQEGKGLLDMTPLQFQSVGAVFMVVTKGDKVVSVQSLKGGVQSEQIHKICKFGLQNRK